MKKVFGFLLSFALIFSANYFNISVSAEGYATPDMLNGTDNLFLSYTFNTPAPSSGHHSKEGYMPLVGYYDTSGTLRDIFFDSYLYLPCVTSTPSGGKTYRDNLNPANFSDWKLFVDDVFLKDFNIFALDAAVGETKAKLGSKYNDFKANVFLTVLYPVKTQKNFGDVDVDGITENFNSLSDRKKAIKWIIDEQISRYNKADFKNLNLVGFYWFEENFDYSDSQESEILFYMNSYVHSKNLKTIWIPYYNASGYSSWKNYGFDVACYQPNYMFNENATTSRVTAACDRAKQLGMGIEMEISGSVFNSVTYYNRYMDYLKYATLRGANAGVKMYYNDAGNGVYYDAYASKNPAIRRIYDLTYKYASKTLDPNEVTYLKQGNYYEGYNIVSLNCSYTATQSYTNTTMGYGSVSGLELTDGIFGSSDYGTEWIGFHNSRTENGFYYINVDLGKVTDALSLFSIELSENIGSGISLPSEVEYFSSKDGSSYSSLGKSIFETPSIGYTYAQTKLTDPVSARYIRAKIKPGSSNFVFASEFSIGVKTSDLSTLKPKDGENIILNSTDKTCKGFSPNDTVADIKNSFVQSVTVKNKNGGTLADSSFLHTGDKIVYTVNGTIISEYIVYIIGDMNSDGRINATDYLILKRTFLGTYSADNETRILADINCDQKINALDYLILKRYFLGTYDIYKNVK